MAIGMIAATLGSVVLVEGVAALLDHMVGNPEADVQTALQQLASRNQRRAMNIMAVEQLGQEHVEQQFSRFNEIPGRALSQAAIRGGGGPALGGNTQLLDMVAAKMGIDPQQLGRSSHPARLGDMSSVIRRTGKSPQ